jgi:hypothetical protein
VAEARLRAVGLSVDPPVEKQVYEALVAAFADSGVPADTSPRYGDAWRLAALHEGMERDEPEPGYALSPRSTRGATRA